VIDAISIIEVVVHKLIGQGVEHITKSLGEQVGTQIAALNERMARIENMLEMELARHVKTGLTFVELGEFSKARDAFVKAEAIDPNAATAKLWLAKLLVVEGYGKPAFRRYVEALLLNPFLEHVPPSNDLNDVMRATWGRELDHWVATKFGNRVRAWLTYSVPDETVVSKMSCGGLNPVVQWSLGGKTVLSAFRLSDGECLWNRRCREEQTLCFATPRRVITRLLGPPEEYELLDPESGKTLRRMGSEYFHVVFGPAEAELQTLQPFTASNQAMRVPEMAEVQAVGSYEGVDDTKLCTDPFGGQLFQVSLTNRWTIRYPHHFIDMDTGERPRLLCSAQIRRTR
jgi:tetratricopeptide (TPR) repeat protein